MEENRGGRERNNSNDHEDVNSREYLLSFAQQLAKSVIDFARYEAMPESTNSWSMYDELDTPEGLEGKVLLELFRDKRYRGYLEFFAKTQDVDRYLSQRMASEMADMDEVIEWISSNVDLLPMMGSAN